MRNARVEILLSTYKGSQYLPELLRSLRDQTHTNISLAVRDDGSEDGTAELLRGWSSPRLRLTETSGQHFGATKSFLTLLREADSGADFFAFCDQDDVWPADKIENAVSMLWGRTNGTPTLYCSRLEYVDAELRRTGFSPIPAHIGFANALVENIAPGCTMVLNREARSVLLQGEPRYALAHDAWSYLVISGLGEVIYDPRPLILYRQHAGNAIGAARGALDKFGRRFKRVGRSGGWPLGFSKQAAEFCLMYGAQLSREKRAVLGRFLGSQEGTLSRVLYAARMEVQRQSAVDAALLRLLIAAGRA